MSRNLRFLIIPGLISVLFSATLEAADPNAAETRLREALRSTMLQLRDAQNQVAALQTSQAESDQKNKELTAQVQTLTKQSAADKDTDDKAISGLKSKLANLETQIAKLKEALEKSEGDYKQAAEVARSKETERAKLADDAIKLQRIVADQQTRNAAMFKLGNEILARYEKFGLGDALTAREPFIGTTRVKFENLMQDYQDKLTDQKIKPSDEKPTDKTPASSANKEQKPEPSSDKGSDKKSKS